MKNKIISKNPLFISAKNFKTLVLFDKFSALGKIGRIDS
jgi:hypothetical protein